MIPRKIHYCWFGGNPLPKSARKCIKSWKKFFPDYEIIEWNESNFNIKFNKYAYEAYNKKKYAFFTDVARLYIIYNHGGIYFDTDVEVIKPYTDILEQCNLFFGIQNGNLVNTGLGFGSTRGHKVLKDMLKSYDNIHFVNNDGSIDTTTCPVRNSPVLKKYGFTLDGTLELIDGVKVLPKDYFDTLNCITGKVNTSENAHSVHWYNASWQTKPQKIKIKIKRFAKKILKDE